MSPRCQYDHTAVARNTSVTLYYKIHLLKSVKKFGKHCDYFLLLIYINLGCLPLITILMIFSLSCKKVIFLFVDIY